MSKKMAKSNVDPKAVTMAKYGNYMVITDQPENKEELRKAVASHMSEQKDAVPL